MAQRDIEVQLLKFSKAPLKTFLGKVWGHSHSQALGC